MFIAWSSSMIINQFDEHSQKPMIVIIICHYASDYASVANENQPLS